MKESRPKCNELDVDFIGGQLPLTNAEEVAISQFLKSEKVNRDRLSAKSTKVANRAKAVAQ